MTGQYYQQPPTQQPHYVLPPEANSIKSMVMLAGIFGILMILVGIIVIIWFMISLWPLMLAGLILVMLGYLFYSNCNEINKMVDQGQYEQAKSKTFLWMIVGILFVFFIPGVLLLIAYMKFDSLINASRGMDHMPTPPLKQRICLGCGQQIAANYNNCPHCGKPVKK
ncbi:MAG: zinc ribbon domain-containing protein [Thermoplasmata archaeon]|nr:zinc ribbon domain-containing protein [Thermoplasmata archaeon]